MIAHTVQALMNLLLVNSNSTTAVTDRLVTAAQAVAAPGTQITGVTAAGAAVIRTHLEFAEAAVHTVATLKKKAPGHDAGIIACFGDPGLRAARHELNIPVVGIAEAAMLTAHLLGGRYSIITLGSHHAINIADLARSYGLEARLASVRIAQIRYADVLAEPTQAVEAFVAAGREAITQDGADVLILGGGPMAGLGRQMEVLVEAPVLDGIACATKLAESLVACGYRTSRRGLYQLL